MGCCQSDPCSLLPRETATEPKVPKAASFPPTAEERPADRSIQKVSSVGGKLIMGKYKMNMGKEDLMGEGTSSICRKGLNVHTGEEVAIKVYKRQKDAHNAEAIKMQKFRRQIDVLKQLQEPFVRPSDPRLWNDQLADMKPCRLFMQLTDYSKDTSGEPGLDAEDGILYVITELAQYSLKDYLALRRDTNRPLPKDTVMSITKALVLVMAGLHAKGLVHLDLKPENLMMFDGRLKLIDVDGCVKASSTVSIQDSSISFSPCYCAPEWARFLIEETESGIKISPALDAWSVGMTICELVCLDAVLKPMYANFLRNGHTHREAGFLFMDWLSSIKKVPLPRIIEKFDPELADLICNWLLVCDSRQRKSCAECLSSPYMAAALPVVPSPLTPGTPEPAETPSAAATVSQEVTLTVDEPVSRVVRRRAQDDSCKAPLFKGTLWKLNTDGNPQDPTHWLKRDMWLAANGSLCYFSHKENKRLVLIDCSKLHGATITPFEGSVRENAFKVKARSDDQNEAEVTIAFACESATECAEWNENLRSAMTMDAVMVTMRLGSMAEEWRQIKLSVKNRRMKVEGDDRDQFAPVFKGKLWKVKAEGDRKRAEDWFQREMWIAKNGSLVYLSVKEDRDLVYYTGDDLAKATVQEIPNEDAFHPWPFQVQLPPAGDVEFTPGEFAAESEEMRQEWIDHLTKLHAA